MRALRYMATDVLNYLREPVMWVLLALWAGFCVWVAIMVGTGIAFAVFFGVPFVLLLSVKIGAIYGSVPDAQARTGIQASQEGAAVNPGRPAPGMRLSAYQVNGRVSIESTQPPDAPEQWAVRLTGGLCLSRSGEWEDEPTPSQRDEAFLSRCRFGSPDDALRTYQQSCEAQPTRPCGA